MLLLKPRSILAATVGLWVNAFAISAEPTNTVRVQGVSAISRVLKAAVPQLRELGVDLKVGEDCGNAQAIEALGNNKIEIALLGRPITAEDRAGYPEKSFQETKIGTQTLAVLVPRSVWTSGVQALKKEQIIKLYEGKAATWEEFGGEKRSVKFFEPMHGQGVWEVFAGWLYGDLRKAPAVPWEVVKSGADTQSAVQFFSGASSVAAVRWADGREVFPIAIIDDSGIAVAPTAENVAAGKYPLSRPAYVVVGLKPAAGRRKVLEFLLSEKGQALVADNDLLPVARAPAPALQ